MKILGKEIVFDFSLVNCMARYEDAFEEYMKDLEEAKKFNGKEADGMRCLCEIVYKFFDKVIGEEERKKIFGVENNLKHCIEALGQIIQAKEDSIRELNNLIDKYTPKEA